jgi:4-amino-4-deoxy-L-arabinose transferase-like glycosyltransferase
MRSLLATLMFLNAGLFFFGAIQHLGVSIGSFHEPIIHPAAIVEATCGLALATGAIALLLAASGRRLAIIANFIAIAGVSLGMVALAAGRGPRTASNDTYHHIMLSLAIASLLVLFGNRSAAT